MNSFEATSNFIQFVMVHDILQFGKFTLKSGRVSPYFFNAGLFDNGNKIHTLAEAFATTIQETNLQFDSLYGPAYKGIPLCVSTSIALYRNGWTTGYTFNRKEAKDHGDKGFTVGKSIKKKRVLILDDVITSGTSIDEAVETIKADGGEAVGVVVIVDRQEVGLDGKTSAIDRVKIKHDIPVYSILELDDIIRMCPIQYRESMVTYRARYGLPK